MPKKKPEELKYGMQRVGNDSAYKTKQSKETYYRPGVYINKSAYPEMVEFLKAKPSVSEYIISLILTDMARSQES